MIFLFALILSGSGTPTLSKGMMLLALGGILWVYPVRFDLGRSANWGLAGLVLAGLMGLIPSFGLARRQWWIDAQETVGIALPPTVSVQPLVTLQGIMLLAASIVWIYFIWERPLDRSLRKRLLLGFSFITGLLAGISLIANAIGARHPLMPEISYFDFFKNPNRSGSLYMLGGIASFALVVQGFRRRQYLLLTAAVPLILVVWAMALRPSRAAMILLFAGCLLWLIFVQKRSLLLKTGLPFLVLAFSIALFLGSATFDEVVSAITHPKEVSQDLRLKIYHDAGSLIAEHGLIGSGMGTFASIFPQYQERSANGKTALHPESDWLWLASEMGLLGVFCVLWLVWQGLRCWWPFDRTRDRSYRLIAITGASVFGLHSLVAVPGHHHGSLFAVIFLAALGKRTPEGGEVQGQRCKVKGSEEEEVLGSKFNVLGSRFRVPSFVEESGTQKVDSRSRTSDLRTFLRSYVAGFGRRVVPIFLMALGVAWSIAALFALPWESRQVTDWTRSKMQAALEAGDAEALQGAAETALAWHPLHWQTYALRAQGLLHLQGAVAAAERDFARARFAEPGLAQVAFFEGIVWLPFRPQDAIAAWHDCFYRKAVNPNALYRRMIAEARSYPHAWEGVKQLSRHRPALRFAYLMALPEEAFTSAIQWDIKDAPELRKFSPGEQLKLLDKWSESNPGRHLVRFFERRPGLAEAHWKHHARALAHMEQWQQAIKIVRENTSSPEFPSPGPMQDARVRQSKFFANPKDVVQGARLLRRHLRARNWSEALRILDRLLDLSPSPPLALYWKAEILYLQGEYHESWEAWDAYLKR